MNTMIERFKLLRKKLGFTQTQLAQELSISPSLVGSYENGDRKINDRIISHMSSMYGVNVDWLKYGNGPMFLPPKDGVSAMADEIIKICKLNKDQALVLKTFLNLSDRDKPVVADFIKDLFEMRDREQNTDPDQAIRDAVEDFIKSKKEESQSAIGDSNSAG